MTLYNTWKAFFLNLASNEACNVNMEEFGAALAADISNGDKLKALTEDQDTVILGADNNKQIIAFHSPHNFGGTRARKDVKVGCLLGFGPVAVGVIVDEGTLTAACSIVTPTIDELAACASAAEVAALATPAEGGAVTFEGSASFLPAPFLRDAIINHGSLKPFEIIPVASAVDVE